MTPEQIAELIAERDTLRAQLDAVRGQEPVGEVSKFAAKLLFEANAMRSAISGECIEGSFHLLNWEDKPHRVVNDACKLIEQAASLLLSAPVAPAQLSELQSGDELPKLPEEVSFFPYRGSGYRRQEMQSYARQAQAMARAKLLAELGKVEAVAVADGTFNHNRPLGTPLYIRPLPAQDVNAELVEALEQVARWYETEGYCLDECDVPPAIRAMHKGNATQQREQK